jgi:agmatine deiminase
MTDTRRMPAEWSPHQATWISWPHNPDTWPSVLEAARDAMTDAVVALAEHEQVHINVQDEAMAQTVLRRLKGRVPPERVSLERIPTDDAWIRDYGAIIVRDPAAKGGFAACDFDYNAWGGKYPPFDRDQAVARQMAERLGLPILKSELILEGGSVEPNGLGLGLVTEQCLLNPNRNPGVSRAEIEQILGEYLGFDELLWLGDGVVGDDTDGHIDNLARFFATDSVVTIVERDRADPNHAPLADNLARLKAFRDRKGRALEVVELPVPEPVVFKGTRLPASYANFYIANGVVIMPSYKGRHDDRARGVVADCFPGRRVVTVDCRSLVVGLGAFHCLTQQIPVIVAR